MAETKLTLQSTDDVVVRMYGQGFGDCFLLAFPRLSASGAADRENPVYVLIDCGLFFLTPGERQRMDQVVRNIGIATGGTIDLLVVTHEHHDHLSGFAYAADVWQTIAVRKIWLGWTEDAQNPAAQRYNEERQALQRQLAFAQQVIRERATSDPALALELEHILALDAFVPANTPANGTSEQPLAAAGQVSKTSDRVLDDFTATPGKRFRAIEPPTEREFCEPGQVRTVPGTAVDAYVLGPPTDPDLLGLELVEREVYPEDPPPDDPDPALTEPPWAQLALAAATTRAERLGLGDALEAHAGSGSAADRYAPFRASLSIPYAHARDDYFFRERYFTLGAKRQIEGDWLRGVGQLALQLDNLTNNTSLVLAFRLPDGRMLLFVGDAQVGNWLSWQRIKPRHWRRPDGGTVPYRPTAKQILAHTIVYKVGHHGSRNATLQKRGLELMADDLIAFVPVSQRTPQKDRSPEWQIPLRSLMERLRDKSGGKIVMPHTNPYTSAAFERRIESADDMLPPMQRDEQVLEEPVPLWRQVRITLPEAP